MNIAGVEIGPGHPCRTVAEVSNAHNGDFARCIRILDAIRASGATFCKFQCYTPDELVALRGDGPAPEPWGGQGWTMRDLYTKAQTPHAWFPELVAHCQAIGLPWFASVFGADSLALMESLGCPAYKIASLDRKHHWLAQACHDTGKPVIQSVPNWEEAWVLADCVLYCPPGYPQDTIRFRECMDFENPLYDGFSYHGTDVLVPVVAVAAMYAGLVECHFQLDEEPSELEAKVSLSATQFKTMVDMIRKAEAVL